MINIDELTSTKLNKAYVLRHNLPVSLANLAGFNTLAEFKSYLSQRTVCVTMLAGSGSRWVESLKEAHKTGLYTNASVDEPRGLFPVKNCISEKPRVLPIASYALFASAGLGKHVIIVRGFEQQIEQKILQPLGYGQGDWTFFTQGTVGDKPRGHGDAAFQSMHLWENADYVLVNFGGDASSPLTAFLSLAALHLLNKDKSVGLVMPVALVNNAAYPVALHENGLPKSFGHAKLMGTKAYDDSAYTNVGVRVYKAKTLKMAIEHIRKLYWTSDGGYEIPDNTAIDKYGGEFALDNVDAYMASLGIARVFNIAMSEELSPVKTLSGISNFEQNIGKVFQDLADGNTAHSI